MFLLTAIDAPGLLSESAQVDPLVERCRSGDGAAWRALYDAHFAFAYRTARRLGLPNGDVEDAAQEAFEVAFQRLGDFRTGRFTTWLYRIVANVVAARLRKRRVREFFAAMVSASHDDEGESHAPRIEARRTLEQVQGILQKMSREKREAFALHEIEGLTHEEIAELVGVKVETVRTRLFYARRDFAKHAARLGIEP